MKSTVKQYNSPR